MIPVNLYIITLPIAMRSVILDLAFRNYTCKINFDFFVYIGRRSGCLYVRKSQN